MEKQYWAIIRGNHAPYGHEPIPGVVWVDCIWVDEKEMEGLKKFFGDDLEVISEDWAMELFEDEGNLPTVWTRAARRSILKSFGCL